MKKNIYSFPADSQTIEKIIESFEEDFFKDPPQYAQYRIDYDDCTIIIYSSGKVVFQGKNAKIYAASFFPEEMAEVLENNETTSTPVLPQAGSDEVGTGDLFGPVCVANAYVDEKIYQKIKHLNIIDSKQLTDKAIREIAPEIMKKVPYSLMILDNAKYNEVYPKNNMNKIKARMHNQGYLNLQKKVRLPERIVIDDFCGESLYYHYLKDEKEVVRNITFETKAENKYISVACGAIIARYAFLTKMDEMGKKYDCVFPKGAGANVDEFLDDFIKKHSQEELRNVAKLNFKNLEKLQG